jgi:hypothetical protein
LDSYKVFKIEMENGLKGHKFSKYIHFLSDKDAFRVYIWVVWIVGLIMNIFIMSAFEVDSPNGKFYSSEEYATIIGISIFMICLAGVILIFWNWTKYSMIVEINKVLWRREKKSEPKGII